jgi:beta-galactosidase/beta-glucuronidase
MTKYYREGYPRPQFVRNSWLNLDGKWNFRFDDSMEGEKQGWQKGFEDREITVPFAYESGQSGIGNGQHHEAVWYSRKVDFGVLTEESRVAAAGNRICLNFEGVDYRADLWVNGSFIGSHEGGYTRFSFDITAALEGSEATVVIRASDPPDPSRSRGKQRWLKDSYDCWYVQTTGIWKDVWAECVSETHIENIRMSPDYDHNSVAVEYSLAGLTRAGQSLTELETTISFGDEIICRNRDTVSADYYRREYSLDCKQMKWGVRCWSPEKPDLYDVCVRLYRDGQLTDQAGSYFGLRKISTGNGRICLNNRDCYLKMVLDQGYWENTGLTPPDEEALRKDIDRIMEYGYNAVRMHQKIEDERFYYWADVKGLLVWCEAPSFYEIADRTIGDFTGEWVRTVKQFYNHPSVMAWVPFNESWGIRKIFSDRKPQDFTLAVYHLTKALDGTRPVISNDGWEHTRSDIVTIHDYSETGEEQRNHLDHLQEMLENRLPVNGSQYLFASGFHYEGQPVMITEFGGIAYERKADGWGYGNTETDEKAFLERFKGLADAIMENRSICGFCYTQLTDVQQEQNGHTYMNRVNKISPEKISEIINPDKHA